MHPRFVERAARPTDHAAFAAFSRELHTDDPVPDLARWEREMMPGTFFLDDVELGRAAVGYAFVERFGERGYVRHVVVHPEHRGRGVGRALMDHLASRLLRAGARRWELNVKRDNVAAIRLYESCGMREQYSTHVMRLEWADIERLPSPEVGLHASRAVAEDDARIERTFGLPAGQVASLRAAERDVVTKLVGPDGDVVGFARFDPTFPGCFPFRVRRVANARVLLESLRPFAKPAPSWLQLVVEDDAATSSALFAAGARPSFEILHLHGEIPGIERVNTPST